MSWLCSRSQTLNRRLLARPVTASIRGLRGTHASSPVFLDRSAHTCSTASASSRSPLGSGLTAARFVERRQLPEMLLPEKTTYEGMDEHLDSERLMQLGHNSFGFSRASFVASESKSCLEEHYMLGQQLGRGATATVYQSLSCGTYEKVAVKAIQKQFVRDEQVWLNEIQIHRAVDHPNIVRLLDTFEDDRMVYLVLELCEGGDLRDHLHWDGTEGDGQLLMPEEDALRLFQQMVSSVHYLHRRGVVHRDIKPGNFLCQGGSSDPEPGSLTVKLADFGVSAYCGENEKHLLTRKIGSDGYIAPEVMRHQPYTEKADIFSLGCILHTMLAGSPPRLQKGTYIVDDMKLQSTSEEMRRLLASLLEPRPEDRPSAESLLQLPLLGQRPSCRELRQASLPSSEQLLDRMEAYSSFPLLKRAALVAMVSQAVSDADFADLTHTFTSICSSSGSNSQARPGISSEDIREFLPLQKCLGLSGCRLQTTGRARQHRSQRELEDLVHGIDASGTISYSEWLASTVEPAWYMEPKRIAAAFRMFDQDLDGLVSAEDLRCTLPDVFDTLPVDQVLKGTKLAARQSSWIDEEEFSLLIRARNSSISAFNG